jgi:hypothetical protein
MHDGVGRPDDGVLDGFCCYLFVRKDGVETHKKWTPVSILRLDTF